MLILAGVIATQVVSPSSVKGYITTGRRLSDNVIDLRSSDGTRICAEDTLSNFACITCCAEAYGVNQGAWNSSAREAFFNSCFNHCNSSFSSSTSSQYSPSSSWSSSFSSYSACASPVNCARGFTGGCRTSDCLQTFNTGYCIASGLCAIVDVRCLDQTSCFRSSSSSVPSSTSSSRRSSSSSRPLMSTSRSSGR